MNVKKTVVDPITLLNQFDQMYRHLVDTEDYTPLQAKLPASLKILASMGFPTKNFSTFDNLNTTGPTPPKASRAF